MRAGAPSRGSRCGAPYRCAGEDQSLDDAEVDAAGVLVAAGAGEVLLSDEAAGVVELPDGELSEDDDEEEDFDELDPLRLSVL